MSLKSLLGGVMDGELGHPDLLRRVVDGIAKLKRHADRGVEVLPPEVEVHITVGEGSVQVIERFVSDPAFDREVEVHITVGEGSVQVIQRFVDEPSFDREVEAALRNKLVRAREDRMPVRRYFVNAGKKTQVSVKETPPKTYQLKIEGGDRAGNTIAMPGDKRVFLVGRGPWHGDDQQVANDVVVSETEKAISRRAARLHRVSGSFELEALDQKLERRADGQTHDSIRVAPSAQNALLAGALAGAQAGERSEQKVCERDVEPMSRVEPASRRSDLRS